MKVITEPEYKSLSMIWWACIVEELEQETSAFANISTKLAQKAGQYTKKVEVPQWYQKFTRIFSEEASQQFPPQWPWDHAIELKKDAPTTLNCNIYPQWQKKK